MFFCNFTLSLVLSNCSVGDERRRGTRTSFKAGITIQIRIQLNRKIQIQIKNTSCNIFEEDELGNDRNDTRTSLLTPKVGCALGIIFNIIIPRLPYSWKVRMCTQFTVSSYLINIFLERKVKVEYGIITWYLTILFWRCHVV